MSNFDAELEGLFDDVVNGDVFQTSGYIYPGAYILDIKEIKHFKSAKDNKWWFLVICEIIQTTYAEQNPGDRVAWRVDRSKVSAGGNILGFMEAASQWIHGDRAMSRDDLKNKETGLGKAFLAWLMQNKWIEEGVQFVLRADAAHTKKQDGGEFTKVDWSLPGNGLTPAELKPQTQVAQPAPQPAAG